MPAAGPHPHARRRAWALLAVLAALAPSVALAAPAGLDHSVASRARAVVVAIPSGRSVAAEPGVRFEHHVTYDFDPAAKVVHVRHEATVANTRPDRIEGAYIRQSYLPALGIPVVAQATGLVATKSDGSALDVHAESSGSPYVTIASIDLQPNVFYGQSQSVRLTYDLPQVPPRTDSFLRVNEAFVSFPVFLNGDPGRTSVEVRIPSSFTPEVVGDEMERDDEDGMTVLRAEPADPSIWFASIFARNDEALVSETVDVGDHDVIIRAWPDDPAWSEFATTQARNGIPALEAAIGLDWPATRDLDIVETAAPYLYGYAGWYQPLDSVVEVGDELDAQVMLHELAHLWFNDDLFVDRWISEGLAEVFAAAVVADGGAVAHPIPIDRAAPGAFPLNDWGTPNIQEGGADEQEAFGYNAAWYVVDSVTSEVGLEAVAEVVRLAEAGTIAYDGPGLPERGSRRSGWRQLLDLLEERAGSTTALELFSTHVVGATDADLFADRTESRRRYDALEASGDGWLPPAAVRIAMAGWRFDSANSLIAEADHVLEVRRSIDEVLAGLDAETTGLEDAYEASRNLDDLAATAEVAAEAADDVRAAASAADRSVGPLGAVGLLFNSVDDRVDRAADAFTQGNFAAASREADAAVAIVDTAARDGALRLLALAALVLVALAVRPAVRRHRHARAAARVAATEGELPPRDAAPEPQDLELVDEIRDPVR